jgi:hypothetical protein
VLSKLLTLATKWQDLLKNYSNLSVSLRYNTTLSIWFGLIWLNWIDLNSLL